jgi:hypothetical protein
METRTLTHDELLKKLEKLDPLLVAAIDEVDESLLTEFRTLSLEEKIERASLTAADLKQFKSNE